MPPIPDLVQISRLDTKFCLEPEYTQHIQYVSGGALERRRIPKEERWSKEKRLGRGSAGDVWLEQCIHGDREGAVRAVKQVQKQENDNYYRELEAIALFSHAKYEQCFVKSFGWYDDDESIFIAMEYLPKGDLQGYLGSPLTERECQNIVSQILEGIVFMHQIGFAHRDLKPANILVVCGRPNWWVKIADFGISKRATEGLTALRTLTGTPAFAAPEIIGFIQSDSYTNAVDIWSLGVIAFLILTGETLFKDQRRLGNYVRGSFKFPTDILLSNNVSKHGIDLIGSLMAVKPEDRLTAEESLENPWLSSLSMEPAPLEDQRAVEETKSSERLPYYPDVEASASWSTHKNLLSHTLLYSTQANKSPEAPASLNSLRPSPLYEPPREIKEINKLSKSLSASVDKNGSLSVKTSIEQKERDSGAKGRTVIPFLTGNYILGKTVGTGNMGKVRLAKHAENGALVAVKILPRHSADKGDYNQSVLDYDREIRIAREAATITLFHHPSICGIRDVVRTTYHWYLALEYISGSQMLDYIISHGYLREKYARRFSRQIASALDYSHRNSIVHRDLTLENILITKTGDIKIINFGQCNLYSPDGHLKTTSFEHRHYVAPELLRGDGFKGYRGPEIDIWQFGIVLYALVCGNVPFRDDKTSTDKRLTAFYKKITDCVINYPRHLSYECEVLISRMLVTDPRQRASLREIMNHPWMIKGFGAPPENHLPHRKEIKLPLDPEVVSAMTGFNFGTPESINARLTQIIKSEEYQNIIRTATRENQSQNLTSVRKNLFSIEFWKGTNRPATISNTSAETEAPERGKDPFNAFHPLISVYYLVREKQERDRAAINQAQGRKIIDAVA